MILRRIQRFFGKTHWHQWNFRQRKLMDNWGQVFVIEYKYCKECCQSKDAKVRIV